MSSNDQRAAATFRRSCARRSFSCDTSAHTKNLRRTRRDRAWSSARLRRALRPGRQRPGRREVEGGSVTTSTQSRTSQSINSQSLILQAIYDGLFGAFTSPPAGAPVPSGGLDATKVYVSLNWPGSQIDISDFANPWSPNNPNG